MKPEIKKQIILHLPYLAFIYLFGKVGQAFRLAQGADMLRILFAASTSRKSRTAQKSVLLEFLPLRTSWCRKY